MKILWVSPYFLHPTTSGGRIRTLQILRRLHLRHEVHFAAPSLPGVPEGPERAGEYSSRSYWVPRGVADKRSVAFLGQLAKGLFSPVPLAVSRFYSPELEQILRELIERERFDRQVCDFLATAPHIPDLHRAVLFQHNVETVIWRRRAQHASNPASRAYLQLQAERMFRYERRACRAAGAVLAVSAVDARTMRELFGVKVVHDIPTGVDVDFFSRSQPHIPAHDLLFVGSMDWAPNVDGVKHFLREILPRIHVRRPQAVFAIVGRDPPPELLAAARQDPRIIVTGTVPDVRPYLWNAKVAVVPLRIGGGTRLKIYECMAARIPVVSTHVGAEGLGVSHPETIRLADSADQFAGECLELLESETERARMAEAAWQLVSSSFSSERVAQCFEQVLQAAPVAAGSH
jgi:polysaccharide biosynthesis protein PslH